MEQFEELFEKLNKTIQEVASTLGEALMWWTERIAESLSEIDWETVGKYLQREEKRNALEGYIRSRQRERQ